MNSMDHFRRDSHHDNRETIRVVLEGGPPDLPSEMLINHSVLANKKVKVPRYGGYEHYELINDYFSETDGSPVFRWTMRTKVAE
ncbi:MAG: hypothetical protein JO345_27430 [Streptosporangiaceae bacterium]|nr:hypothetical protein [Streptosporangiaceae bacterium]